MALLHQVPSGRPITVTVEERSDDSTVQHTREGFVMRFASPFGDDVIPANEALYVKPFGIRRTTTKTRIVRGIRFLKRTRAHGVCTSGLGRVSVSARAQSVFC
jgi:hypothetical protein